MLLTASFKILLAAMSWGVCVRRLPDESERKTSLVASAVAHLPAVIILCYENQFGNLQLTKKQNKTTVLSAQLLVCPSELDRWMLFPVHWQICILARLCDAIMYTCVFVCKRPQSERFSPSKGNSPLLSVLSVSICPSHNKNTGSTEHELLTQTCAVADLISWNSPHFKCEPRCVNKRPLTMTGSCVRVFTVYHKQM